MNHLTHRFRRFAILLALAGTAACGGKQVDTSIPLNEARNLNSDLSAAFVRTSDLVAESASVVARLGTLPNGVRANDFDIALVREVLLSCFSEPTGIAPGTALDELPRKAEAVAGAGHTPLTVRPAVGRAPACRPARLIALEAYLDVVRAELREFLLTRTLEVDAVRVNLRDVAVAQLDNLERVASDTTARLASLRATTEERHALALTADLDEEARRQHDRDYDAILVELDQIAAVLADVNTEATQLRQLRRTLIEEAERNITAMGTAP